MILALGTASSYAVVIACSALASRDCEKGCVGNGKKVLQILTRPVHNISIALWPHLLVCAETE